MHTRTPLAIACPLLATLIAGCGSGPLGTGAADGTPAQARLLQDDSTVRALPGTPASCCTVFVSDAKGRGVAGLTLGASVVSGGGSVTGTLSDKGGGTYTGLRWTLGTTPGRNELRITVPGVGQRSVVRVTADDAARSVTGTFDLVRIDNLAYPRTPAQGGFEIRDEDVVLAARLELTADHFALTVSTHAYFRGVFDTLVVRGRRVAVQDSPLSAVALVADSVNSSAGRLVEQAPEGRMLVLILLDGTLRLVPDLMFSWMVGLPNDFQRRS